MMERTKAACRAPGDLDVLEVATLASEESRVFGPESRHAEHGGRRRRHGADTDSGRSGRHAEDGDPGGVGAAARRRTRGDDAACPRSRALASGRFASPTNLASPVGFTFMPTGRLVYLERNTGWLRFRNLQTGVDRPRPPDLERQLRRRTRGARRRGASRLADPAVRLRLRDEEHRRRSPQPGPADQGRRTATAWGSGGSCRSPPARPATTTAAGSCSDPTRSSTS